MDRSVVETLKPWIIATIGTGAGFALFFGIAFVIIEAFGLRTAVGLAIGN